MAATALSGAALNATDAALRGGNAGEGAVIGGLAGPAGLVTGRAVGSAIQGARNLFRGAVAPPAPASTVRVGNVDVPLSSGQATGDVATQMMEQTALRGGEGQAPQRVAQQFFHGEQAPAVEQARANIGTSFDRFGQVLADDPYAAAELAQQTVQGTERASRANYGHLYDAALGMPGEIHAGALENIGQNIKGQLTLGNSPVIIDDVTTPVASRMIQDIDNHIAQLRIQNRADPFGQPNPENVVGVNLVGVDQTRKRLMSMAASAQPGSADRRAASRVISAFDDHIEGAMERGLFTGDDRALDMLRQARSAYAEHRQTFRSQGAGDDVGRAMERIIGRNGGEGATPTEVANYLYGNARVGATGLSVRLAQRMRGVLGDGSPEWAALRQGLWARLTQATEGATEMGPQRIASRISEFLRGSGAPMAQVMFTPQERNLMRQFAALQQQLTPKPGTVNYSNTAPVLRMLANNALRGILASLGAVHSGPIGAVAGFYGHHVMSGAATALGERSAAGRVARSLYRSPAQNAPKRASPIRWGVTARLPPAWLAIRGLQLNDSVATKSFANASPHGFSSAAWVGA
jgi:hypothetical protein